MKTTTITKLDFIMLILCLIPSITLITAFFDISMVRISQTLLSIINTFCVMIPMIYSVYRMSNGYKNIASLFILCITSLFVLSFCASIFGMISPYII